MSNDTITLAPTYVTDHLPPGPPGINEGSGVGMPEDVLKIERANAHFVEVISNGSALYNAMWTNNTLTVMSECIRGLSGKPESEVRSQMNMHCTAGIFALEYYSRLPGKFGPYFVGAGQSWLCMSTYATSTTAKPEAVQNSHAIDFYGDPMMPIQAIAYWIYGGGITRNVRIESLNLQMVATDFQPIVSILSDPNNSVGAYRIKSPFSYNVFDKAPIDLPAAGMLGRISGEVEGTLQIMTDGTYQFNGVYHLNPDLYDAGSSNRTPSQEGLTTFLRQLGETFGHTDYSINIIGEKTVDFSGSR
ncbi:lipid II-degrading bacteriocin [Pseudomonas yamanorum]|uniref:lipid II-degrading bacteriocin n=1 Tax=Pseudomonas yamanorum TaxID=515393 RepID=UPI003B9E8DA4